MANDNDTKYFEYLEKLREGGTINMFGAPPYLQREFGLDKDEALAVWTRWTETYKD